VLLSDVHGCPPVWVYGCACVRLRDCVVLVESRPFFGARCVVVVPPPNLTPPTSLIPPPSCQMTVRVRTPLKARAFATVTAMRPIVAWPGESAEDAGAAAAAPPAGG
jgi:hypothetical protein